MAFPKSEFYPVICAIQVRLNLIRGEITLQNNNLQKFISDFRDALAGSEVDDTTAQVSLLMGLEPKHYLLYRVLKDWQGGTLEYVYLKVWRLYTGVVHPYMMQQIAQTPLGSSPM